MVRVLPASVKVRWWAWCNGPPWWQAQDGWPQRFFTRARLAARTGPAGTSCFSRLSSIRRTSVGWLETRIDGPLGLPVSAPYTRKGPKKQRCEEKNWHWTRRNASTMVRLETWAAAKVRRMPHFSGLMELDLLYNNVLYDREIDARTCDLRRWNRGSSVTPTRVGQVPR